MKSLFHRPINGVRFRQRVQRTLNCAAWGLCLAALVVLLSPLLAGSILCISILFGLFRPITDSAAARSIDKHYRFKDRILTSIALLRRENRTLMEQLQIDDAAGHLPAVQPRAVHPLRLPKAFWIAVGIFALDFAALAVIHGNFFPPAESSEPVVHTLPAEHRAALEELVAKTEELKQRFTGEEALSKLSEKLDQLMGKFDLTLMNARETLLTLSEMEDALKDALDALQLETMEESLQELAKTLELAEKTMPISRALEKGEYLQAAAELKKLDAEALESLSDAERKALAEEMQKVADNAEKRNQKPLQEAAQQMSDALENEDDQSGKSAADALANEVEKHNIRQQIAQELASQQMELGMIKAENGPGNMSGGEGTDKTDSSSETWGSGSAGISNEGQETELAGQRQEETLTGTLGEEGDSITETVDSDEMTAADSQREYRELYQQYRKLSEAVLDMEPIPLGQRQVIRRYFESIRPALE